jgi:hypothetical protein
MIKNFVVVFSDAFFGQKSSNSVHEIGRLQKRQTNIAVGTKLRETEKPQNLINISRQG